MIRQNERGSVLILILVGVALFGALSVTVSGIMRAGNPEVIAEQRGAILADEVLAYARQIRQAVQSVRITGGCADEDISFENIRLAGYANGSNTECQIFNENGGGITYQKLATDISDDDWLFSGASEIDQLGTTCAAAGCYDLVMIVPIKLRAICSAINYKLGITGIRDNPPIDESVLISLNFLLEIMVALREGKLGMLATSWMLGQLDA